MSKRERYAYWGQLVDSQTLAAVVVGPDAPRADTVDHSAKVNKRQQRDIGTRELAQCGRAPKSILAKAILYHAGSAVRIAWWPVPVGCELHVAISAYCSVCIRNTSPSGRSGIDTALLRFITKVIQLDCKPRATQPRRIA